VEINIRLAKASDAKDISRLSSELGYSFPENRTVQILTELLSHSEHTILVAENSNSNLIGYIHLHDYKLLFHEPIMNILGLVVDQHYIGKGIGSALMKRTEEIAKHKNYSAIRANSGSHRYEAHKFYEAKGFDGTKTQVRFIKYLNHQHNENAS
jgi:predicted N-acetyltransferase YhbS